MKNLNRIELLIEKLKDSTISSSEMLELKLYLNSEEPSSEIKDLFVDEWDKSSRYNNEIDAQQSLAKVHEKLNLLPEENKNSDRKISLQKNINALLRYAAVFLIAVVSTYFFWNQDKKIPQDTQTYLENSSIEVSYGSKSKVNLPDGSVVHLNSGSKLTYPAVFEKGRREVTLEGEGHFEVKSDSLNPFFVNTDEVVIRVIGTVFNVKSYPESGTIETTLVSGSLEVMNKNEKEKKEGRRKVIRLEPNQKAIFIKSIDRLTLDEKQDINVNSLKTSIPEVKLKKDIVVTPEIAWKDNLLIFENAKFEDMILRLERWYNVKIKIDIETLKAERFSGKFENETIEQVLKALQIIEDFDYEIKQNNIRIFN